MHLWEWHRKWGRWTEEKEWPGSSTAVPVLDHNDTIWPPAPQRRRHIRGHSTHPNLHINRPLQPNSRQPMLYMTNGLIGLLNQSLTWKRTFVADITTKACFVKLIEYLRIIYSTTVPKVLPMPLHQLPQEFKTVTVPANLEEASFYMSLHTNIGTM